MNEKALSTLEYNKIIEQLTARASSEPGRQLCRNLLPMTDRQDITTAQGHTRDALSRLFKKGGISFGSNKPLGRSLSSLEIQSCLSCSELMSIADFLENVNRVKSYGRREREDMAEDTLDPFFQQLEPLTFLSSEIRRCIIGEEEYADDATPALKHLRRQRVLLNDKIHVQLNKMVNGSLRTYLQDAVITMRNNRYCIPVKTEYKGQVAGMIHDQSSTGSTLFIEPSAIVELNNRLKELDLQEEDEIEKILTDLSLMAGEHTPALATNQQIMTQLDFIFAKGLLALDQNATEPVFNDDFSLHIRKGRHPLLDKRKVVPIDISLGRDFSLLIITGPNTGGKTVSLKTVGLFTLMGQAGLHIPAADRSRLAIFDNVYADIGDEQSIEQNLSTFSSHMKNIIHILNAATYKSLCLFDELCAGTDPTEGAALAIAILSTLLKKGIRTMATTHYSELKVFALSSDHVENACCEFDVETLSPTYRLLVGIPGKSNAFAISSKLGLDKNVILLAKEQLSDDKESFEDLLASLEDSRTTIEKDKQQIAAYKNEVKILKEQLQKKSDKIEQSKDRILREANEKARQILEEAKTAADETIRIFQKAGPGASMKDLERERANLRKKIDDKNESLQIKPEKPKSEALKPNQLKLGDSVKIISMGLKGIVSTLPDTKGNLFVQCGIIRSQTNIRDLMLIEEATISGPGLSRSSTSKIKMSKSFSVSTEINLLGKTVDEALAVLDKYLDDAYLAHLPSVRIVHGKGTGALRKAVQVHLKKTSYVKSFRLGEHGEGDAGVTIAEFK